MSDKRKSNTRTKRAELKNKHHPKETEYNRIFQTYNYCVIHGYTSHKPVLMEYAYFEISNI